MNETFKKKAKIIIAVVAICIAIYLGLQNIGVLAKAFTFVFSLISPLLIGLIFALILNVPMSFFEKNLFKKTKKKWVKKMKRPLAVIISIIFILGVVAAILGLVLPALADAFKIITQSISETVVYFSNITEEQILDLPLGKFILKIDWDKIAVSVQDWLKNQSSNIVNSAFGTIGSILGSIVNFFIEFIFALYILFSKETLKAQAKRLICAWIPSRFSSPVLHTFDVASKIFRSFVAGQTLEALILGLLCTLGMLILQIPYAPMVGALIGVTALVPVVGAFLGAGVGAFMILTVSPVKALIFLIFILILQQIEGNLIYPKVMGNQVNLPAIWILAAVTVGGSLAGPVGMLLGVPVASTAYVLLKEATVKREQLKK